MTDVTHGLGTVGLVGLGELGSSIAACYARGGIDLVAHDLRAEMQDAVELWGARWAPDFEHLVRTSDVLCVCLLDDRQVLALVDGGRLFESMRPRSTLVIHSTVSPATMAHLASLGSPRGVVVVDAPVSGTRAEQVEGRMTVMVGAESSSFERLQPLWQAISAHTVHVAAEPGAGQVVKLCNNLMAEVNYLVALEAIRIAELSGVAESTLVDAVRRASGGSWVTENWGNFERNMLCHPQGGPEARFTILLKDLESAVEMGLAAGARPLVATLAAAVGESILGRRHDQVVADRDWWLSPQSVAD
jgi:3-hydroxyisobutyrate dehydrogenase